MYCTALYCTVLYYTVLYSTVMYCTALYCTVLYYSVMYCTVLYCTYVTDIFITVCTFSLMIKNNHDYMNYFIANSTSYYFIFVSISIVFLSLVYFISFHRLNIEIYIIVKCYILSIHFLPHIVIFMTTISIPFLFLFFILPLFLHLLSFLFYWNGVIFSFTVSSLWQQLLFHMNSYP